MTKIGIIINLLLNDEHNNILHFQCTKSVCAYYKENSITFSDTSLKKTSDKQNLW